MSIFGGFLFIEARTPHIAIRQVLSPEELDENIWLHLEFLTGMMRRKLLDADPRASTQDIEWDMYWPAPYNLESTVH